MAVNLNCVICEVSFWDAAGFEKERIVEFFVDQKVLKGEIDCGKCSGLVELDKKLFEFRYSKRVSVKKKPV